MLAFESSTWLLSNQSIQGHSLFLIANWKDVLLKKIRYISSHFDESKLLKQIASHHSKSSPNKNQQHEPIPVWWPRIRDRIYMETFPLLLSHDHDRHWKRKYFLILKYMKYISENIFWNFYHWHLLINDNRIDMLCEISSQTESQIIGFWSENF